MAPARKQRGKLYRPMAALLSEAQFDFLDAIAEKRTIKRNQALRDVIDHARACPLFLNSNSFGESLPSTEGK